MATPDGITLDKASYAPGDKVTITVVDSKRTKTTPLDWASVFSSLTASLVVVAKGALTAPGYTFTVVSDDGTTAVLTTTA